MKRLITSLQVMTLVCSLHHAYGKTIKVPAKEPTIQAGIDAAVAGDTVKVAAGTYTEDIFLKSGVIVQGAGADRTTIRGTGAGSVVTAIGVDASAKIDGFTITGGSDYGIICDSSSPTISNTIISGNSSSGISCRFDSAPEITNNVIMENGGGIGCLQSSPKIVGNVIKDNLGGGIGCMGSSPAIADNVIKNNTTEWGAGGIWLGSHSYPEIINNEIIDNTSIHGIGGVECDVDTSPLIMGNTIRGNAGVFGRAGGIYSYRAYPWIINNEIVANFAGVLGGGIAVDVRSLSEIIGNKIVDNVGQHGGGIYGWGSEATVINNVIAGNDALTGGGVYAAFSELDITNNVIVGNSAPVGGGVYSYWSALRVVNSILWENGDDLYGLPYIQTAFTTYSCIEDGDAGEGNISLNPLFVDAANGDYRLQALSPCIDTGKNLAGLPAADMLGNPRIVDGDADSIPVVDMGPYEYAPLIIVEIDIKPGSAVNPVNLRSNGMIQVALITTEDFDAWTVDVSTIIFGPNGASPVHVSSDDVDGDGDLDMVLHFRQQDTGIGSDDTIATLTGRTTDNAPFTGEDAITVVTKQEKG